MYFPLLILHSWEKRSAVQPQTIYSEVPYNAPWYHRSPENARKSMKPVKNQQGISVVTSILPSAAASCRSPATMQVSFCAAT